MGWLASRYSPSSGDLKGKVEDIYFDETTGNIVGLEVEGKFTSKHSNASVQLRPADIVSIGPDAVVINMASVPILEAQGAGGPRPLDEPGAPTTDTPSAVSTDAPMPTLADVPATSDTQTTGDSTGEYARLSGIALADQMAQSGTSFDSPTPATSSDATVQLPPEPNQGRDN